MIRPFYVIRILQDEKQPVYWKSHSYPASPSLGGGYRLSRRKFRLGSQADRKDVDT